MEPTTTLLETSGTTASAVVGSLPVVSELLVVGGGMVSEEISERTAVSRVLMKHPCSPELPICSACIEGWLARPEDGEPDRASVIWRDELLCGWHASLLADDAPAVHIFGRRPESEWGKRVD